MTTGEPSHVPLPAHAGVGLRSLHIAEVMSTHPAVPWFEIHAENYMGGGPTVRMLERIRQDYPIAIHGVGLSLGSADGLDARHLTRLKRLVDRMEPVLVSEHLSWSITGGTYLNHLLPLAYTEETLEIMCRNVDQAQTALGRCLLVENPANYLRFAGASIPEPEFLTAVVRRTGCGLLCDVNNIYVTSQNLAYNPIAYLETVPVDIVGEMHLAGHAVNDADGQPILIDDHGAAVSEAVWELFILATARFGPVPTLIEWDTNIPAFAVLMAEARKADRWLDTGRRGTTDAAMG
jgi:uncharacterized protein (UPF0276 family)